MKRSVAFVVALLALIVAAGLYELLIGFPRTIEGKRVHRVTRWYAYSLALPLPYERGVLYYAYTDARGNEVRHGPYRDLHRNGRVRYRAFYRDGELDGTATTWNERGIKTNEEFYRRGKHIGWVVYLDGRLHYLNEEIFEGDHAIASKRFEGGRFRLAFYCGALIDRAIDPTTGEVTKVPSDGRRACE